METLGLLATETIFPSLQINLVFLLVFARLETVQGFSFPIFKTKIEGHGKKFMLENPVERRKYFALKAGGEIEKLRDYLQKGNTFVGFLLGPKNSGKGTYTKLFMEAVGEERVAHISVGDIVRSVHKDLEDKDVRENLLRHMKLRYRGFVTLEKALDIILGRDTKTLLPTEVILALMEQEIAKREKKAIFIDGFPRDLDQVSFSLYFRALIGYRDDPDFFVFIDVPESVIDERMKYRVICPLCHTPRSTRLLRTQNIGYDAAVENFYLICDNPHCGGFNSSRMVSKEGDELGIEAVRDRIEIDAKVMQRLLGLEGIPKVFLRNTVPVRLAEEFIDDYEITPSYRYELEKGGVKVIEEPWLIKDQEGQESYSLLPPAIAVALIKQVASVLGL